MKKVAAIQLRGKQVKEFNEVFLNVEAGGSGCRGLWELCPACPASRDPLSELLWGRRHCPPMAPQGTFHGRWALAGEGKLFLACYSWEQHSHHSDSRHWMGTGLKLSLLAICCIFKTIISYYTEFPRHVVDSLSVGLLKSSFMTIQRVVMSWCRQKACAWCGDLLLTCALWRIRGTSKLVIKMSLSSLLYNPRLFSQLPLSLDTNIHFTFKLESLCSVSMGKWQGRSLTISRYQKNSNFNCTL